MCRVAAWHAGIKGIWNLRKASNDSFDTYLVLAFVGETRILEINADDELDEAEIEGFEAEQQVRLCRVYIGGCVYGAEALMYTSGCWVW